MRLLVVEDEIKIARALERALRQEHYAVDLAYNGDDGLAMASSEPYDLIILDRLLPGKYDGLGIIKELRKEKNNVPVILLTALGSTNQKTEGLDAGADDYLVKPFALEELLARIRALLRRPTAVEGDIIRVDDLTLDTATKTVRRGEREIQLTGTEFALLEYLMRMRGRPVSKATIIAHVWNFDADILPNTVEVYIRYLRRKIDGTSARPLIKTVRGMGYVIG